MNDNSTVEPAASDECVSGAVVAEGGVATFVACYMQQVRANALVAAFIYSLVASVLLVNTTLIVLVVREPRRRANVFNQIVLAHALVNLANCVLDLPFYSLFVLFGYWPLGRLACFAWSVMDNALNTIMIAHMLFLTWTRYASIRAPQAYKRHWSARHSYAVSALIWALAIGVYVPLHVVFLLNVPGQYWQCVPLYSPQYLRIVVMSVMVVGPLVMLVALTLAVMCSLRRLRRKWARVKKHRRSIVAEISKSACTLPQRRQQQQLQHQQRSAISVSVFCAAVATAVAAVDNAAALTITTTTMQGEQQLEEEVRACCLNYILAR